jgi:hypothetical protein
MQHAANENHDSAKANSTTKEKKLQLSQCEHEYLTDEPQPLVAGVSLPGI